LFAFVRSFVVIGPGWKKEEEEERWIVSKKNMSRLSDCLVLSVCVRGFGRTVDQLRAQWGVASLPKQQQQQQHPPTVHKKKKKKKLRGRVRSSICREK
jgi:hypothetical protein